MGHPGGTPLTAYGVPTAEPPLAGDGEQRPLRCGCSPRLKRSVRLVGALECMLQLH